MKRGQKTAVILAATGLSLFAAHAFWGQIGIALLVATPLVLVPFIYLLKEV